MAVTSKEVVEAYEAKMIAPFDDSELKELTRRESTIDSKIKEKFDGGEVYVELSYFKMPSYDYSIPARRKNLMYDELVSRYEKAGWVLKAKFDDGLDGPNMSGPDYMVMKPRPRVNTRSIEK